MVRRLAAVVWMALVGGLCLAAETDSDLSARIARVRIGVSTLESVVKQLGEPAEYLWGSERFTRQNLPERYIVKYDGGLSIVFAGGKVNEVRVTDPAYVLAGTVRVGSPAQEVFEALGKPKKTVQVQALPQRAEDGVFYTDLEGRAGSGYYALPARGVRFFFENDAVQAIYLMRDQPARAPGIPAAPAAKVPPSVQFISHLSAGQFEAAGKMLDPTMRRAVTDDQLGAIWADLVSKFGAFEKQTGTRATRQAGYDIFLVGCEFERGSVVLRVVASAGGRISGFFIASTGAKGASDMGEKEAEYVDRASFTEVGVTVGQGKWAVPGTLSLPKSPRPCPAVVLVHGSGPNDRDETIGANKPFKDLAWGLASQGVAVLRYDKRTYAKKLLLAVSSEPLTVKEEVIDDVAAAVALLRVRKEIDGGRVFVLGHSLGGMLVPRIAAATDAAGFIILAGPTRPLEEVMVEQMEYITSLDGTITPDEAAAVQAMQEAMAKVKLLTAGSKESIVGAPAEYWLDLKGYDPAAAAQQVKSPMLILHGGRDYQVTARDLARWKERLATRADVRIREYPALNHLFISGEGTPGPEEYQRPGHVAPEVIRDIAEWLALPPPAGP